MATMITSECINCGACEPECPNTAIYQGGVPWEFNGAEHPPLSEDLFYIVPEKCTECVGFHDQEACQAVCPVECCIPNPDIPETEEQLILRAKELHPEEEFGSEFPSRFRASQPAAATDETPPSAEAPGELPATPSRPMAVPPAQSVGLELPSVDTWEVPIDCYSCHGTYAVAFKHLRSGVVLRCPFCTATYIVTTTMHNSVSRALQEFHRRWSADFESFRERRQQELDAFEERQRRELETFSESLKGLSQAVKPPGAPRKRAWIFG